jgi:hypothetical protein
LQRRAGSAARVIAKHGLSGWFSQTHRQHRSGRTTSLQMLAQTLEERMPHLALCRFGGYSISASSLGSTHMPLCAIRFASGWVLRISGVRRFCRWAAENGDRNRLMMSGAMQLRHLEEAERHVAEGEKHIALQERIADTIL